MGVVLSYILHFSIYLMTFSLVSLLLDKDADLKANFLWYYDFAEGDYEFRFLFIITAMSLYPHSSPS